MRLICIGDNVADFYLDRKMIYPGGSTYNVAVQARRNGLKTAYIGPLGDDRAGKHLYEVLQKEGVDVSHTNILAGKNAYSQVVLEKGERRFLKIDKGVYQEIVLTEKDYKFIKGFNLCHSTIYSYTEEYLPVLKEMGLTISFDYSFINERTYLERTAPFVDLAFFSGKAIKKDYEAFMSSVNQLGITYVLVTLGDKGAILLHNDQFYYQPVQRIKPLDTLGAGDAFIAMFLVCMLKRSTLKTAMAKAVRAGREVCRHYGAVGRGISMI